jgi:hypothetical protein
MKQVTNFIIVYLPWLLSILTIYMTVLTGNKDKNTWLVGLFNQFLWLLWIVLSATWGLLPLNFVLWIIYIRNHRKWKMEN